MSEPTSDDQSLFADIALRQGVVIEERVDPKGFPGTILLHIRKPVEGETPRYVRLTRQ